MKGKILTTLVTISLILSVSSATTAATKTPQEILKSKYPNEVITVVKTDDIDYDQTKESFILTRSGNFYLINSKGYVVLINTGIISDEDFGIDPTIKIFSVAPKEKQVAVTFSYFPSNTQLYVYRLKDGTLKKTLELMGDQGVDIDSKGRIHQYWKKFRNEGGWDLAEGVFTWSAGGNKFKGSGQFVTR
jgi:hypothetical protein